jgi:hypothetical protein
MGKNAKAAGFDPHAEIEKNQRRLRENIEQSKLLLERTRQLIAKARAALAPRKHGRSAR